PHALGYDQDFEGDESFAGSEGHNTFSDLLDAFQDPDIGALSIFLAALAALLVWQRIGKKIAGAWMPPALLAVAVGSAVNLVFKTYAPDLHLTDPTHLV